MDKKKVLIVDDEILNLQLLEGLLEDFYSVVISTNGEDALKKATEIHPNIILLDIMMPGMDGFEVCRHLKENNQTAKIPVIFQSALNAASSLQEGYQLGAVDYLVKPYSPEQLLQSVAYHLNP